MKCADLVHLQSFDKCIPTHQPLPNQPQPTTPTPSTPRPPALLGRSKEPEGKATENKTDSLSKIFSDESSSALGSP